MGRIAACRDHTDKVPLVIAWCSTPGRCPAPEVSGKKIVIDASGAKKGGRCRRPLLERQGCEREHTPSQVYRSQQLIVVAEADLSISNNRSCRLKHDVAVDDQNANEGLSLVLMLLPLYW